MKPVLVLLVGVASITFGPFGTSGTFGQAAAERPRILTVEHPAGPNVSQKVRSADGGVIYAPAHRTIFMNRNATTYTPGSDDSRTNSSSIISSTANVPA